MSQVVLALVIGLVFIYAEFYVPGGVFALVGATSLLLSLLLVVNDLPSHFHVFAYLLFVLLALYTTIQLAIWRIKRLDGSYYLENTQSGFAASSYEGSCVGKKGVTVTALRPSGYISIMGERYVASSSAGFIDVGEPVIVTKGEGANLIVRPVIVETEVSE